MIQVRLTDNAWCPMSRFSDMGYIYDARPMVTTTAAICATRKVSCSRSFYRGEQYDSDLGLYYLRARYYNPATGRFLSRDPLDGQVKDPASLHKYLYANGDPVNGMDPNGQEDLVATGWLTKARVVAAVLYASACGWAIYDLYDKIDDALDNVYNMPGPSYDPHGHHYVPEWQVLRSVYTAAAACGGPGVAFLIASY